MTAPTNNLPSCPTCQHHRPWKPGQRSDSCERLGLLDVDEPCHEDGAPERCPLRKARR